MKRKIISVILTAIYLSAFFSVAKAESSFCKIYVSPYGSDENDGSFDSELATLAGAKMRVRELKDDYDNIEVIFKAGTYRFDSSVVFTVEDSATDGGRITYKGADGEKVYFKGSKLIDKSKFGSVTDADAISRLPDSSKVIAVNLADLGITAENYNPVADGVDDYILFADNKRQKVAAWPNGEEEYGESDSVSKSKLSEWKNAGDFYLYAYWTNDYNAYRKKLTGSEAESTIMGITSDTGRFKILHMLEELDTPGEWYIDREKNILYYYPYEDFAETEIELAALKDSMITMYYTDGITFENIHFANSRGRAITSATITGWDVNERSENVDIKNCIFSGLGYTAVYAGGSNLGYVEDGEYNRNTLNYWNGVKNWTIEGNSFYNLSYGAIILDAGAITPLASGECVIKNNYIYNTNLSSVNHAAVWLRNGVGNQVLNNVIHHIPYHAVNYNGNNNVIKRNELYNANRHSIDCGVVYTGRSFYQRGGVVEENYIHDSNPVNTSYDKSNNAIYFDDTINGQTAKNNLIVNVQRGVCANGSQANTVEGNIMYGLEYNVHLNDMFLISDGIKEMKDKEFDRMKYAEGFVDAYPESMDIYKYYKTDFALNTVKNNLAFGGELFLASTENNEVENNLIFDIYEDFERAVNEKNGVFSVSGNSFNMAEVGILMNSGLQDVLYKDFKVRYPFNSSGISWLENCRFEWEKATGADRYRVEIATDADFNNIVLTKETDYNFCDVNMSISKGNYYWRAVAINKSGAFANEWTSDTGTITVKGWF